METEVGIGKVQGVEDNGSQNAQQTSKHLLNKPMSRTTCSTLKDHGIVAHLQLPDIAVNLLPRIMAVGCLGYPGASTVVSRPPDRLRHYWQIPGPQP